MENQENKKNASERLSDLESTQQQIIQALQPIDSLVREMMLMKETVKLLNNKLESVIKAINENKPLTNENINQLMIDSNVKELADKVAKMVSEGLLAASDTVSKDSFVVLSESNADGIVTNPRLQFLLSSIQSEQIRAKLEGSKVGDKISVADSGESVTVLETYNIVLPQAPAQELTPATAEVASNAATDTAVSGSAAADASASATQATDTASTAPAATEATAADSAASA